MICGRLRGGTPTNGEKKWTLPTDILNPRTSPVSFTTDNQTTHVLSAVQPHSIHSSTPSMCESELAQTPMPNLFMNESVEFIENRNNDEVLTGIEDQMESTNFSDGRARSRSVAIDMNESKEAIYPEKLQLVDRGLWIPARTGLLVAIQQWRVLEGNFKFFCGGRLMRGPGHPYWWLILIAHLLVSTVCCLWFDILPVKISILSCLLVIGTILFTVLTILSILQVACSNPGYTRRPDVEERVDNLVEYLAEKSPTREVTKVMVLNGKKVNCSFCEICCHYRCPQVEHCPTCDSCIERFDHHNKTFGICIGKRNIGAFIRFLFLVQIHFQIVQTVAFANIIANVNEHGWQLASFFASPTLYVLLLSSFHPPYGPLRLLWILLKQLNNFRLNRTTYESRQQSFPTVGVEPEEKSPNAWNQICTFWKNFKTLVICPKRKSSLKLRAMIKIRARQKELKRLKSGKPYSVYPLSAIENSLGTGSSFLLLQKDRRRTRLRHTLLRRSRTTIPPNLTNGHDDNGEHAPLVQEVPVATGFHRWTVLMPPPHQRRRQRKARNPIHMVNRL